MIGGVTTTNCVTGTTYGAVNRGYETVVLANCVSNAFFKQLDGMFKIVEFSRDKNIKLASSFDLWFRESEDKV